ncbi:STAS domain-containing protein [Streptacidiphilus sp. ASG 303]|uniref:STAS domain-containing protein n=1 Tax=Streptacidiphilus sp. ASG 303 TaxID=2896847 RepID=UPI001E301FF7|nr:STAS domain-containing protein [Streptacidiphilus sp. ASG 303]MCD0484288.1 STAS domain-containing protein [Streptacidiphilus sp. ASG 303]
MEARTEVDATGTVRVAVAGDVDFDTCPVLAAELAPLAERAAATVVVDLTEVSFMDSSGLHVLLAARHRISAAGGRMRIVGAREQALFLFEVAGVTGLLDAA